MLPGHTLRIWCSDMRRVRVRRHIRIVRGQSHEIPEHWRHIGDRTEVVTVERDELTGDLFGEIETICALASMPDGAVIAGALLEAARKEWR